MLTLVVSTSFFICHMRTLLTQPSRVSRSLLASFVMNLMLLAALIVLWQGRREPVPAVAAAMPVRPVKTTDLVKAPEPVAKATTFQWRQLDAPDFATYVKNLRAIGCPELTIRDIVTGELAEIYEQKRQMAATTGSGALLEAEMSRLKTEQTQLLAHLTAPAASTVPSSASVTAENQPSTATYDKNDTQAVKQAAASPVSVPAAFTYGTTASTALAQDGSQVMLAAGVAETQLPPAATTALQQLQSDFVAALGDTVQNPDSPVYRQRWNTAQRDSDERFSSLFGGDAFIKTQIEAARAAAAGK